MSNGTTLDIEQLCAKCQRPLAVQHRTCIVCGADNGPPNVRLAGSEGNREALDKRFTAASAQLDAEERREMQAFVERVNASSGVVVAVPGQVALGMLSNSNQLYRGYEALTDANLIAPAAPDNDKVRRAVSSELFPSFATEITYGALSMGDLGLPTYGSVFFRLNDFAIENRVSFLEDNSFDFNAKYDEPYTTAYHEGFSSCWDNRGSLVFAKLGQSILSKSHDEQDGAILYSDCVNRHNDIFIEAHLYGVFNIESVQCSTINAMAEGDDAELGAMAIKLWEKRIGKSEGVQ